MRESPTAKLRVAMPQLLKDLQRQKRRGMEYKTIIYEKDEKGIVKITINRPEVRNALNRVVRTELKKAVQDINQDKGVRVVIITGAGASFCAGAFRTS